MKKGNVIDMITYRDLHDAKTSNAPNISNELKMAIQLLILRLREQNPIKSLD